MYSSDKLKILCDENIPIKVTELLNKKGFDVKKVPGGSNDKNKIVKLVKSSPKIKPFRP